MKTYTTRVELEKDWYTVADLFKYLEKLGFPHSKFSLFAWEKKGYIPAPKRAHVNGVPFRIYNKDESDFKEIVSHLEPRSKKTIEVK